MKKQPFFRPRRPNPAQAKAAEYSQLRIVGNAVATGDHEAPVFRHVTVSDDFALGEIGATSNAATTLDAVFQAVQDLRASQVRTVWLSALGSPDWRLRTPLPVEVQRDEDGQIVARSLDLEVFAAGESELAALDALREVLLEEFEMLSAEEATLGPHPTRLLQRFRELIEPAER